MPVITIEGGKMDVDQKRALTSALTTEAAEIMKVSKEHFIVLIKENDLQNIGSGGTLLSDRG